MKKITALFLLLVIATAYVFAAAKDPIVIEVVTKHANMEEALTAAKNILLGKKFIATNGIQEKSFTATRTTMAKADYFVADVTASEAGGKIKITVSFVKIGTGLLNLKKIASEVKAELEK